MPFRNPQAEAFFKASAVPDSPLVDFSSQSWYQDALSRYQDNPDYLAILQANPYLSFNRHQTGWQKMLNSLGMNTNYDKYVQEMENNAKQYQANAVASFSENAYNSYDQDAQRMRSAGLNPDLLGAQGVGQMSANESPNPVGMPELPSPGDQLLNFTSMIGNIVQTGFGIANGLVGIKDMFANLDTKQLSNQGLLQSLAQHTFLNMLPSESPDNNSAYGALINKIGSFRSEDYFPSLSHRSHRAMNRYFSDYAAGLPASGEAYRAWLDKFQNRSSYVRGRSSKFYDGSSSDFGFMDDIMSDINKPLVEASDEIAKLKVEIEKESAEVDKGNLDVLSNPENLGADARQHLDDLKTQGDSNLTERAVNATTRLAQQTQKILNQKLTRIMSNLEKKADSGNPIANAMLFSAAIANLGIVSMPSFSRSSSSTVGTNEVSDSRSWKFGF